MKQLFILITLLAGVGTAKADYSDYFRVKTMKSEVENGGTVLYCTPQHINEGFDDNWFDYELIMLIENVTDENLDVSCTYTWGSYPTPQEYLDQGGYGYAKMCGLGYCYSTDFETYLGQCSVPVQTGQDIELALQLLNTPLDLVSEYKFIVYPNVDPDAKFECNIVFAPSEAAANKFLGIGGEIIDKTVIISPEMNSTLKEIDKIEISSENYNVSLNPEMAGSEITVYTRTGVPAGLIAYDDISISATPRSVAILQLKEPITEEGIYTIHLPDGYLKFGTEEEGFDFPATSIHYTVDHTDLSTQLDITPEAGVVSELSGFTINVPGLSPTWKQDSHYKFVSATLTLPDGNVVDLSPSDFKEVLEDPDDFWSAILGQSYEFTTTYSQVGKYELNIPAGMFYIDEGGNNVNPEWNVVWTIGVPVGVLSVSGDSSLVDVYSFGGVRVISKGNADRLKSLPAGLYIINGKKVSIK